MEKARRGVVTVSIGYIQVNIIHGIFRIPHEEHPLPPIKPSPSRIPVITHPIDILGVVYGHDIVDQIIDIEIVLDRFVSLVGYQPGVGHCHRLIPVVHIPVDRPVHVFEGVPFFFFTALVFRQE